MQFVSMFRFILLFLCILSFLPHQLFSCSFSCPCFSLCSPSSLFQMHILIISDHAIRRHQNNFLSLFLGMFLMFLDSSAIKASKRMEVRKRSSIAMKIESRSILTCIASTGHLGISRSNFYHSFLIVPSPPPFIHAGCLGCLFCTLPSLGHRAFCVVSFFYFLPVINILRPEAAC